MENNIRENLIDYAMSHFCDLIPYDSENYMSELNQLSEDYADWVLGNDDNRIMYGGSIDDVFIDDDLPW